MEEKMLQQIMTAPKEIQFQRVDIPKIGSNEVLVKIKRIGICGSDIHVYHGKHPYTSYPVTQGHEVSGQIADIGDDVKSLRIGQKVTIEPQVYCGECYPCTHGKYNLCENLKVMGFQTVGTASEYFAVDASKITPLPDEMSYEEGAMIEPLAVTVHACNRFGDVANKNVIVMGSGPIGILLCQVLKAFGAAKVMATDISDYRLELAKNLGADWVFNTKKTPFAQAVDSCFGKDKADVIFDCAGNDITMNEAIANARKGSDIILVAVFAKMATVDLAKLNDSELTLNTSMMYRHEDYLQAIEIVKNGKVNLKPLISKHFAFEDYVLAYQYIDTNYEKTMKIIVDVDQQEKENE